MKYITRIIMFLLLTGVFLSGSISMIEDWLYLSDGILAFSCIGIIIVYLLFFREGLNIPKQITIVYSVFVLFAFMSSLSNGSMQSFFSSFRYILVFLALTIITPNILKEKTFSIAIGSVLFSHMPLLILSFIEQNPFVSLTGSYFGIFYNPNSFGSIVATVFVLILALLFRYIGTKKYIIQFFLIVSLFIFLLLTIFSGSRTSFTSIVLISLIGVVLYYIKNLSFNKISLRKVRNIFILIITLAMGFYWFLKTSYYEIFRIMIIDKFLRKSNSGDILDQRGGLWESTISDMSILGHGPHYFENTFGIGAHSTFISIAGQFGLIVVIVFVLMWILVVIKSVRFTMNKSNYDYNLLPILIISLFLLTSITEIMLMKVSMLLSMIVIGVITLESMIFQEESKQVTYVNYIEKIG